MVTTLLSDLRDLFEPQLALGVNDGILSYYFSLRPGEIELKHITIEGLAELADQVRVLTPAWRPGTILPNLGPAGSDSREQVPPKLRQPHHD